MNERKLVTNQDFANQLIKWYGLYKRDLPWRSTTDPYKIWLSEIILQQTRVTQGMPYYLRFVEQYPTVFDLAKAPEDQVLRLWQGLGYYSRARNLHACSKMVVELYDGKFPNHFDELLRLKGIGKYTASAIASFCFDRPTAVVDGNVYRVLSRIYGLHDDISSGQGQKAFEKLANELIDHSRPGEFNQAMMEFGALHCTPKSPACGSCPFTVECYAHNHQAQGRLPVKSKKVKVKTRYFHYLILRDEHGIYMKQRGPKDIWQGLYDFALYESNKAISVDEFMETFPNEFLSHMVLENESKIFKHILTHQRIFATFYQLKMTNPTALKALELSAALKPYTIKEIQELPKPILINNFLATDIF